MVVKEEDNEDEEDDDEIALKTQESKRASHKEEKNADIDKPMIYE